MSQHYLSTSYARILFRHLRLTAENGAAFFSGTNVDYEQLMVLEGQLSFEQQARLFENALKISDYPGLGLSVGTQLHLSAHGPLGVAAFSSPTLGVALETLVKFGDVRAQFVQIGAQNSQAGYGIQMHERLDLGGLRCFLSESVMSAMYSAVMFFTGASPVSCELHFAYPEPKYAKLYADFFRFPVLFGQPVTQILIAHDALDITSPVADAALHQQALGHCETLLRDLTMSDRLFEEQVRSLFNNNPGKLWTIEEISNQLNMSTRTLIRKLKIEGTRFQTVRDEVLKKQAVAYLTDPMLTVESAGYLLGFSDVASFRRSFKRWFGQTPSDYLHHMSRE